jgi:hypothetical protein
MRSFNEYLTESKKTYTFKVKVAGGCSPEQEKTMETLLHKYEVTGFKKTGTTPIQELPLDFPKIKNAEVSIYEVNLAYPTTQFELTEYLASNLNITKESIVVRVPGEPLEEYQTPAEQRKEPLLTDSTYSEAPNAKFEDYYGDKYNTGFVKELNDILKLQRRDRGEQIPTEGTVKYNTDSPAGTQSPIKQSDYNPLRK